VTTWLGWLLIAGAVIGVFVVWDLFVCGGEYCRRFRGGGGGAPPRAGPIPRS
jgi:hypothetical protein